MGVRMAMGDVGRWSEPGSAEYIQSIGEIDVFVKATGPAG